MLRGIYLCKAPY